MGSDPFLPEVKQMVGVYFSGLALGASLIIAIGA
jgi:hypothetical protein